MSRGRSGPALVVLAIAAAVAIPASSRADGPVRLFNGRDLAGWYTYIPHKDGSDPKADPKGVFKVEDGVIHVSGEEFGCLVTSGEHENYRLVVEFRWGERRWPPRENEKRDSGILFHCIGPDKVWPRSIECQIQEGDCGDFWMVDGAELTVRGERHQGGRAAKTRDAERPKGEWNTVEVVCQGGKVTNIVNGVVVNEGTEASLARGKILLQSEGAEVYYRKVELHPLGGPSS